MLDRSVSIHIISPPKSRARPKQDSGMGTKRTQCPKLPCWFMKSAPVVTFIGVSQTGTWRSGRDDKAPLRRSCPAPQPRSLELITRPGHTPPTVLTSTGKKVCSRRPHHCDTKAIITTCSLTCPNCAEVHHVPVSHSLLSQYLWCFAQCRSTPAPLIRPF